MYNRYIPQPDGSFRKSRVSEKKAASPSKAPAPPPIPERKEEECISEGNPVQQPPPRVRRPNPKSQQPYRSKPSGAQGNVINFLRQLLPKNFDTGDLLVILLLLLMSGDSEEDQNTALLTMALYFFL